MLIKNSKSLFIKNFIKVIMMIIKISYKIITILILIIKIIMVALALGIQKMKFLSKKMIYRA